jgi:FtsP/CotA-like multicopper oxidase with cupredoxin domain
VKLTEDKKGFYLNEWKFAPDAEPMTRVKVGSYAHWRVTNATKEIHPFRIIRFIFLSTDGRERPCEGLNGWIR